MKVNFLLSLFFLFILNLSLNANEFPNTLMDADPKSFCVKEPDAFDIDFEHVMIVVDRTTNLADEQIEWIGDNVFSEKFVKNYPPFTRFSLIFADDSSVQLQELQYSKCRPKTGKKSKKFAGDKFGSDENELVVKSTFDRFLKGSDSNQGFINLKSIIGGGAKAENTFVLESFIRVLTDPSLDFSHKDYTKRTLIIASDLMQYSDNLDFYKYCGKNSSFRLNAKQTPCLTFDSLMKNKTISDYIDTTKPSRNLKDLEIKMMYLNFDYETERDIDSALIGLWSDYFSYIGYKVPEDPQDWIERQLDF
tara:strand:+ start:1604 stop:2521 length:918 start_codon:yes stop_codon:yes gene_type:complete